MDHGSYQTVAWHYQMYVFSPSHAMLQLMFVLKAILNVIKYRWLNHVITLSVQGPARPRMVRSCLSRTAAVTLQLCLPLNEGESCRHFPPCHQYLCNPNGEKFEVRDIGIYNSIWALYQMTQGSQRPEGVFYPRKARSYLEATSEILTSLFH